jgi:hypothetical protein
MKNATSKINPLTVIAAMSSDNIQTTFHAIAKSYGTIDKTSDALYSDLKAAGFVGSMVFDRYSPNDTICRFVLHDCWLEGYLVGRGFAAKERLSIEKDFLEYDKSQKSKRPELSDDLVTLRSSALKALSAFMAKYRSYLADGKVPETKPRGANNKASSMTEMQGAIAAFAVTGQRLRNIIDGKEGGNKQLATELLSQMKVVGDMFKGGLSEADRKFMSTLFVTKQPRVSLSTIKEKKPLTATAKTAR